MLSGPVLLGRYGKIKNVGTYNAMKEWVQKNLDKCDVTFDQAENNLDLTALYRGQGFSGRYPTGRRMRWALWKKKAEGMSPYAIAVSACGGIFHDREYGEIRFAQDQIILDRKGCDLNVRKNGVLIGCIRYSTSLRLFYFGNATIWRDKSPFAVLKLPIFGPSLGQSSDCFGRISVLGKGDICFLLNPKNEPWIRYQSGQWTDQHFLSHPPSSSTSLFVSEEAQLLRGLGHEEVYLLLTAALWARMFFTYA